MKTALDIWHRVTTLKFELRLEGENIGLYAPLGGTLPNDLFEALKAHKPELLSLLKFQEEADRLLLESTRRIAQAWPRGYPLESGPRWGELEKDLHAAYFACDLDRLRAVLELREKLAVKLFEAHRKQAAA